MLRGNGVDPFERVQVALAGVWVTRLGLGGAATAGHEIPGASRRTTSYQEGVSATRNAYDAGCRYFDTAPFYGIGRGEVRYGAALCGLRRASLVISTKVGRVLEPDRARGPALIGLTGCRACCPGST